MGALTVPCLMGITGMETRHVKKLVLSTLIAAVFCGGPAVAKPGDASEGEKIYVKQCLGCHGEEGDGAGPAAERLNPPPRDFTLGQYKIKTTGFDDIVPNDEDLFRMIKDGMPGTAMPEWGDILSEEEMWDLTAYIKTFAGFEEEKPTMQVNYGAQVAPSRESIEKGKKLFLEGDRCSECHGEEGKGDGIKKLKDDAGERTWPRNLTKAWSFRASNDPKDIFTRITVGIPGTQMPSFADPVSKKKLTIEERWHVANYVHSLAETRKVVRPENTVVKADKVEGDVPHSPDDQRWQESESSTFFLVPQMIVEERLFTPSNDTLTARAFYNEKEIAILLEWDDRTKSIPGDAQADKISDPGIAEDAVAIQLPMEIPKGMEKPYFLMGDAVKPVNIWQWRSGTADMPQSVRLLDGRGVGDFEERDAAAAGIQGEGVYRNGTWRVVIRRPLMTSEPDKDIQFGKGKFIPIAFFAWDGSNGENGSKHTMTTWYWLLLAPSTGARPFLIALAVMALIAGAEFWWLRSASRKGPEARG